MTFAPLRISVFSFKARHQPPLVGDLDHARQGCVGQDKGGGFRYRTRHVGHALVHDIVDQIDHRSLLSLCFIKPPNFRFGFIPGKAKTHNTYSIFWIPNICFTASGMTQLGVAFQSTNLSFMDNRNFY
jgi:hypothetical protein